MEKEMRICKVCKTKGGSEMLYCLGCDAYFHRSCALKIEKDNEGKNVLSLSNHGIIWCPLCKRVEIG